MEPDDEAPLTLSKWPFYFGDALLVAAALAIGMLSEWPLTGMQVVSCVTAVALGAAILGLPFVVEYLMRVREEQDDRASELRLLKAHLQKAEGALLQYHERLKELESGSGSVDQRCELLAAAVDQKLNASSQGLTTLSQQVGAIEVFKAEQVEAFAALKDQLDALSAAPKDDTSAEAVAELQAALATLEARLTEAVEPLGTIESRVVALEESAQAVAEAATVEATVTPEPETPARAPRQRRKKADAGLLQRAIQEKQDSSSSAVSRIIDSKSKLVAPKPTVEEPAPEIAEAEELPEKVISEKSESQEAEPEATETQELVVELDPVAEPDVIEGLPEDIDVSLGADLIEDDELLETSEIPEQKEVERADDLIVEVVDRAGAEEPTPEPEVTEAVVKETPKAAPEPDAPVDLFGEAEPASTRRARTKANDAVFTVSILIGIGNKPFLRGSGGGLSWETGLPMDFEEIGKWRWVAPSDLEGPVELQVYRNDEDADRKGRYILEPGQKLEVSPVF